MFRSFIFGVSTWCSVHTSYIVSSFTKLVPFTVYWTRWTRHEFTRPQWKKVKPSIQQQWASGRCENSLKIHLTCVLRGRAPKTRKWFVFLIFQLFHKSRVGPLVAQFSQFSYQTVQHSWLGTRRVKNRKKVLFADLMLSYCRFSVTNSGRKKFTKRSRVEKHTHLVQTFTLIWDRDTHAVTYMTIQQRQSTWNENGTDAVWPHEGLKMLVSKTNLESSHKLI